MKIFNVMFSKRAGGIEQSFLDYNSALALNFDVVALIHNQSLVKSQITTPIEEIRQLNKYDPFAIMRIRYVIKKHKPDIIIAHSTRAYVLCKLATKAVPIISVSHNYNFRHLLGSKDIIAITNDMKNELLKANQKNVHVIPNMIGIPKSQKYISPKFHKPFVIGFIGTLTYIKGCDLLIKAVAALRLQNIEIIAKIAGDGEDLKALKDLAKKLNIHKYINFVGWVKGTSKNNFFKSIDALCVPSRHEPFGIVLLEAMKYSKPIVSTKTHGALEVAKNIAVLCDCDSVDALEEGLLKLCSNVQLASSLTKKGFKEVKKYSVENIGKSLQDIVEGVLQR